MLSEAIQQIATLAATATEAKHKAERPHFLETPDPHQFLLVTEDGTTDWDRPPKPRRHQLASVDQFPPLLAAAVEAWEYPSPVVWYNVEQVVAVLDDKSHREARAVCELTHTPEWDWLATNARNLEPREIVKALRTILRDSLPPAELAELIATLRAIKFASGQTINVRTGHGSESIGSDILGDVQSLYKELPEEITFKVRVFDDRALPMQAPIRCAVEIDPKRATFDLLPAEADLVNGIESVMDQLHQLLRSQNATFPILFGNPE